MTAEEVVREFCQEEQIEPEIRDACARAVREGDFTDLNGYETFVVYDALGCYPNRDEALEALYQRARGLLRLNRPLGPPLGPRLGHSGS